MEADRSEVDHMEADRTAADRMAADRMAADHMEADRMAADRTGADRTAADRTETVVGAIRTTRIGLTVCMPRFYCHHCYSNVCIYIISIPDMG